MKLAAAFALLLLAACQPPGAAPGSSPGVAGGDGWAQFSGWCGTTPAMKAYCLEWDARGDVLPPSRIADSLPLRYAAGSRWEGCGLSPEDHAYCWGPELLSGIRGFPAESCGGPWRRGCAWTPTRIGDLRFRSIAVGEGRACGIARSGEAYCWGTERGGRGGGRGTEPCPREKAPCAGLARVEGSRDFRSITVGSRHACALNGAGQAFCWGVGTHGQLGAEAPEQCPEQATTIPCSTTPVAVQGGLRFTEISAGEAHTCALSTRGEAFCWGSSTLGQLGTEQPLEACVFGHVGMPCTSRPVPVAGARRYRTISARGSHTCAVALDGAGYCWGEGGSGELGQGVIEREHPYGERRTPVKVLGDVRFARIDAWGVCGLSVERALYCWGIRSPSRDVAAPIAMPSPPRSNPLVSFDVGPLPTGERPQTRIVHGPRPYVEGIASARCSNYTFHPAVRREGGEIELWLIGRRWEGGGCIETDERFRYRAVLGSLEPGRYGLRIVVHYADDADRIRPEGIRSEVEVRGS